MTIFKKIRLYRIWRRRRKGKVFVDFVRGPGYYFTVGLFGYDPKQHPYEWDLKSGKIGIFQLIDYQQFRDPWDMIKESRWMFLGYKGQKAINDCTFQEYLAIYHKL